ACQIGHDVYGVVPAPAGSKPLQNETTRALPPLTELPVPLGVTAPVKSAGWAIDANHSAVPSRTSVGELKPTRMLHCTTWKSSCASTARGRPPGRASTTAPDDTNDDLPRFLRIRRGDRPVCPSCTWPVAPEPSMTTSTRALPPT